MAVVAGLTGLSFARVIDSPGIVGHTWDWGVPDFAEQVQAMARHHFSTWDAYFETGRYHYFKLELIYWQILTLFAGLGGEFLSKALPLTFVTASGLAMLPLARFLKLDWYYTTLAALFYALSPYTFSRVVAGHMPMLAGYALIPLLLLAFFKLMEAVRQSGRAGARRIIVCGLILGLTSLHPSLGMSCVAMLAILGLYFLAKGPNRKKIVLAVGSVFALAMLMNIHFMAPFLADYLGQGAIRHGWGLSASAKHEVTVDTELPMREAFHQSTSQPADAALLLDLRPGMDTEYAFPQPPGLRGPWLAASLLLALLALSSFMAGRKRPELRGMFWVAVVGLLLVCGSRTPFGQLFYEGLLKTFLPILFAAFSNTTRWLPLIVTAYACLAFQLPQEWERQKTASGRLLRPVLGVAVLIFVSPYLGQQLVRPYAPDKTPQPLSLKTTPISPEDAQVYSFLRDQRADCRVTYLPPVGLSWPGDSPYSFEWTSAYSPKPFFLAFYNNPLGNEIIKTMFAEQPSPHLDRLFGLASVKYLVYPHYRFFISYEDFQPGYRGEPMVDGFKNYKPVLDRNLALQQGLVLEKRFTDVDLYRNPLAGPYVLAGGQMVAVADASGQGMDLTAPALPDVLGLPGYRPGQVFVSAGEDPEFLAMLTKIMGVPQDRSLLLTRRNQSQALLFSGQWREPPSLEYRRLSDTACLVRLRGVKQGFPLVFQETFHHGWKAYLLPLTDWPQAPDTSRLADYRVFPDNQADQASPDELKTYLDQGLVSTLGDGREKIRTSRLYGPGGRTMGLNRQDYRVDFVSKRFLTSLQNDNLPGPAWWTAWRSGGFAPKQAGEPQDPLDPKDWSVEGADKGLAVAWPDLLHWQADGFANVWWLDPGLIESWGPLAGYARPCPGGGLDVEVLIEFRPQRFYLLGLACSGATVGICLLVLLAGVLRPQAKPEAGHA